MPMSQSNKLEKTFPFDKLFNHFQALKLGLGLCVLRKGLLGRWTDNYRRGYEQPIRNSVIVPKALSAPFLSHQSLVDS